MLVALSNDTNIPLSTLYNEHTVRLELNEKKPFEYIVPLPPPQYVGTIKVLDSFMLKTIPHILKNFFFLKWS